MIFLQGKSSVFVLVKGGKNESILSCVISTPLKIGWSSPIFHKYCLNFHLIILT